MPLLPTAANTAENRDTLDDRTPIPAGDYIMAIVKTEFKQTKAKTGHFLSTHFKVQDGEYKGRMVFTNLNLDNPNPVAVEIANKELNSICQACGLEGVEDSDELLNIPMKVTVKVSPGDSQWPPSNETTGYASAEEAMVDPSASGDDNPEAVVDTTGANDSAEAKGGLPWEK